MDTTIKNNVVGDGKQKKWSAYGLIAIMLWTGLLMVSGWTPSIMFGFLKEFNIVIVFFFIQCFIIYQAGNAIENFKIIPRSKAGWIYIILGGLCFISLMPIPVLVIAVFYGIGKGIEKFIKSRKK